MLAGLSWVLQCHQARALFYHSSDGESHDRRAHDQDAHAPQKEPPGSILFKCMHYKGIYTIKSSAKIIPLSSKQLIFPNTKISNRHEDHIHQASLFFCWFLVHEVGATFVFYSSSSPVIMPSEVMHNPEMSADNLLHYVQ